MDDRTRGRRGAIATCFAAALLLLSGPRVQAVSDSLPISGQIRHHGSDAPVSGVTVALQGQAPASMVTDAAGEFTLNALAGDNCSIQPQKRGDDGTAITAGDAVVALGAAVGLMTLDADQQMACDVSGDG